MNHSSAKGRNERSRSEAVTVRIGKKGVTEPLILEISKNLRKKGIVKVKILKTGLGGRKARDIAEEVAKATDSRIIQIRGHTFTLRKPKKIFIRRPSEYSR